jgi:hypothetical protein
MRPASNPFRAAALAPGTRAGWNLTCPACPLRQVNQRHHLKKTDFSEYTEVAIKVMNRLKEAKKAGGH